MLRDSTIVASENRNRAPIALPQTFSPKLPTGKQRKHPSFLMKTISKTSNSFTATAMILECPPLAVRQKLYGRESELRMLNDAFQKSQQPNQPTKYVFVRGRSGAGKSALISEVFKHDNKLCLYGLGKFEQRQDSKPCAALRDALASICMKMSQSRDAQHYKEVLLEQNVEPEALLTIANL